MVMYLNRSLVFWGGLLLVGLAWPAQAHNGALAIAVPVEGVEVDGDLSDWPAGMRRYPIALPESEVAPRDSADYQGCFRLGYDEREQALYLAVEVKDQSSVFDGGETSDGCEVYLAMDHQEGGGPVAQWVIWGDSRRSFGSGKNEDARVEVRRGKGGAVYEWRLDLRRINPESVPTQPATVIAFDVVVTDKDADGSFSWVAWGRGIGKLGSSALLGDMVLAGRGTPMGRLRGTVKWEDQAEGRAYGKARIQSLTSAGFWVQVQPDSLGVYTVELPIGRYRVDAGYRRQKAEGMEVEVREGEMTTVPGIFFPRPPLGVEVKAGRGKVTRAGTGSRQGAWRTFDGSDGFPAQYVAAVFQDQRGNMWLGGLFGGVTRYDGQYLETFTAQEGLASNSVFSILQDREGYLWFGTVGGVSRYDGQLFRTFTTEDGLAGNRVESVFQDREGYLWFGTDGGVSRYDGAQLKTFTIREGLANPNVHSILQDREGHLWFGTDGGVSRYEMQFKNFTTKEGLDHNQVNTIFQDREGHLWFGTDGGVSRYDGTQFYSFKAKVNLHQVTSILQDREGNMWFGTDGGGVSRYDGQQLKTFTAQDGLAENEVQSVFQDREGVVWIGTFVGVSRYDGQQFDSFTTQEGLANNDVRSVFRDREGKLWFGTWGGGVSRYDGKGFKTFTTKEGLANNLVASVFQSQDGYLWFGTWGGGVSRYDGKGFKTFTTREGLAHDYVIRVFQDREGYLWFGTWGGGVSRYDGKGFKTFTTREGLAGNLIWSIFQDREGYLWFGTSEENSEVGGVSRYDGQQFRAFTTYDGLADNWAWSVSQDREGNMWVGTGKGVSRYDGQGFRTFSSQDGLVNDNVHTTFLDRSGSLWFGTYGGLSRYDGQIFQSLFQRDGLAGNVVWGITQDLTGNLWYATIKGVTRFRPPPPSPPPVFIDAVVADQRYEGAEEISSPSTVDLVTFEFHGISFKTWPEAMIYRYRLNGFEENWNTTHERRVEYQNLPVGGYTFEVVAVNRDLEYSEQPAQVRLTIHPPYGIIALAGGLGLALVGLVIASGYGIKRRRERDRSREELVGEQQQRLLAQEALNRELEEELQTAHTLQMDLMPRESPQIPGLDLAGRCIPANHVGGDLFQYFHQEGKLSIALADVTGHAMEAAIPMVMFSGVLKSQIEISGPIEELFGRLNRSLHHAAGSRTFVCFAFGTIDTRTSTLRLSSAAFPYPYHFSAATGEIAELQVDAYPLGVRPDTTYQAIERELAPGDYLVFCSDGIIEATDQTGAQFGYERTVASLHSGCAAGLSAEALLERVVAEVRAFRGETPQGDDQTVVVLRVANGAPPVS